MKHKKESQFFAIRLEKGERLIEKVTDLCAAEKISTGFFSGLGALNEAEMGHFDLETKEYTFKKFEGQYEIVSLHGNISLMGDKPFIHAHITIADQQFGTFGGHLKEAIVGATCEIYLTRLRGKIQRIKDEITGLNLLDISCETDIRR